jgi:hypothetical protein
VLTKRSSFPIGSISMPIGGAGKPAANAASTGVIAVPDGRPVLGSMSIRLRTLLAGLV